MRTGQAIGLGLVVGILGCSSLSVERLLLADVRARDESNGLVVSVNKPHRVTAIFPINPGAPGIVAFEETIALPSIDEYYVVGYTGNLFTSRELQLELNPDSSLKRVKVTSTITLAEDLQSISTALQGVQTDLDEIKALEPEKPNPIDQANSDLRREIINKMLEANRAAVADGNAPPYDDIKLP